MRIALAHMVLAAFAAQDRGALTVELESDGEGPLVSVHARRAPLERVISEIARQLGRSVQGADRLAGHEPLDVYLDARPPARALTWILGTVGLRADLAGDAIVIADETAPYPAETELLALAESAFLYALKDAPRHERSAYAEMALARIQEERGDLEAAVKHYDFVKEKHFAHELAPEALLRSARHLAALGEWALAADRYYELAGLDRPHPYHAVARLELARTLCFLESPKKALHVLDALDTHYPTRDDAKVRERLLVRARGLALAGEGTDALRVLEIVEGTSEQADWSREAREVRALALEALGHAGEAGVAWLAFARDAEGPQRETALRRSARLALEAEDELGALFVHAFAAKQGRAELTLPFADEARARLGLASDDPARTTPARQLARGAELLARGESARAVAALEPLFRHRAQLTPGERLRLAVAHAEALAAQGQAERAIFVLRTVAEGLSEEEARREIYVTASRIHERRGALPEAIEALEGRL